MSSALVQYLQHTFQSEGLDFKDPEHHDYLYRTLREAGYTPKQSLDALAEALPPLANDDVELLRPFYKWHVAKGKAEGLIPETTNNVQMIAGLLALKKQPLKKNLNNASDPGTPMGKKRKNRKTRKGRKTRKN